MQLSNVKMSFLGILILVTWDLVRSFFPERYLKDHKGEQKWMY